MVKKRDQEIVWWDDEDNPRAIRGVTIQNITDDGQGHVEGIWWDNGKPRHVGTYSMVRNTWGFI